MAAGIAAPFVYDPLIAETIEDPYPAFEQMLALHPVYRNEERDFWALSRFDDVRAAIRAWRDYSSSAGVRIDDLLELAVPSPLTMDPPRHDVLRSMPRQPFSTREIAAMEPLVTRHAQRLLDDIAADEEFDAVAQFAKRLPVAVIGELLGLNFDQVSTLKAWADSMLETIPGSSSATPAARAAAENLRAYWVDLLAERRSRPRQDLLSLVAAMEVDGRQLPEDEQVGMCNLIFEAGNATTATLIGNAILALDVFEDQQRWLRDNLDQLPSAIEEFLRFESPVQGLLRVTTSELMMHGVPVPEGSRVLLLLSAANRDPRMWDDPNSLDLSRVPKRNLAFGEGIHFCLGAPLARLEGPIALRLFLERYPKYQVTSKTRFHDVSMRALSSLTVQVG